MFKVWDNIIDDLFIHELDNEIILSEMWALNNIANRKTLPYGYKGEHLIWGADFYNYINRFDVKNNMGPHLKTLWHIILAIFKKGYKDLDISLFKIQGNAQNIGQDGELHNDFYHHEGLKLDCTHTLLYFLNPIWEKNWGGEFIMYNKEKKVDKVIDFNPGRIILFDTGIDHRGLAPKKNNIIRRSLAFRLNIKPLQ